MSTSLHREYDNYVEASKLSRNSTSSVAALANTRPKMNLRVLTESSVIQSTRWLEKLPDDVLGQMMAKCYLEENSDRSPGGSQKYFFKDERHGNRIAAGSEEEIEKLTLKLRSGPNSSICTPVTGRIRDYFPDQWKSSPRVLLGGFGTVLEDEEVDVGTNMPSGLLDSPHWDYIDPTPSPNNVTGDAESPPDPNDTRDTAPAEGILNEVTHPTSDQPPQPNVYDNLPTCANEENPLDNGITEGTGTQSGTNPSNEPTTSRTVHVSSSALPHPNDESTLPPLPPSPILDSPPSALPASETRPSENSALTAGDSQINSNNSDTEGDGEAKHSEHAKFTTASSADINPSTTGESPALTVISQPLENRDVDLVNRVNGLPTNNHNDSTNKAVGMVDQHSASTDTSSDINASGSPATSEPIITEETVTPANETVSPTSGTGDSPLSGDKSASASVRDATSEHSYDSTAGNVRTPETETPAIDSAATVMSAAVLTALLPPTDSGAATSPPVTSVGGAQKILTGQARKNALKKAKKKEKAREKKKAESKHELDDEPEDEEPDSGDNKEPEEAAKSSVEFVPGASSSGRSAYDSDQRFTSGGNLRLGEACRLSILDGSAGHSEVPGNAMGPQPDTSGLVSPNVANADEITGVVENSVNGPAPQAREDLSASTAVPSARNDTPGALIESLTATEIDTEGVSGETSRSSGLLPLSHVELGVNPSSSQITVDNSRTPTIVQTDVPPVEPTLLDGLSLVALAMTSTSPLATSSADMTQPPGLTPPNQTQHNIPAPGDVEFLIDLSDSPPDSLRLLFGVAANHTMETNGTDTCPTSPSSILDEWEDDDIPMTPLTPWQSEPQSATSPSTSFTSFTQNTQSPPEFSSDSIILPLGQDTPLSPVEEGLRSEIDRLNKEIEELRGFLESLSIGSQGSLLRRPSIFLPKLKTIRHKRTRAGKRNQYYLP